jgi:hypothetical protein
MKPATSAEDASDGRGVLDLYPDLELKAAADEISGKVEIELGIERHLIPEAHPGFQDEQRTIALVTKES